MLKPTQSRARRCAALVASSQEYCGNRARYRLTWHFRGTRHPSRLNCCGLHRRPATRQFATHGLVVALRIFARVRA